MQTAVLKALRTDWSTEKFVFEDRHPPFDLCSAPLQLSKPSCFIASRRARGSRGQSAANIPRPSSHSTLGLLSKSRSATSLFSESFRPLPTLSTLRRTKRASAGTSSLNSSLFAQNQQIAKAMCRYAEIPAFHPGDLDTPKIEAAAKN